MAETQRPTTIIDSLGEEIVRIITPVSICMLLVVFLVSILNTDSSSSSSSVTTIATIAYSETSSDSTWDKFLGYLVVIGMLVAYWFTLLPEWTTWVLLVAMALYDLAAVLLPVGPLRLLVELAISRDEDIPALVYEARPVINQDSGSRNGVNQRRVWRDRRNAEHDSGENLNHNSNLNANIGSNSNSSTLVSVGSDRIDARLTRAEEGQVMEGDAELSVPLIDHRMNGRLHRQEEDASSESLLLDGIGLGSSGAIKLGLGDFIFYSVLVGRAAMYDFMTVYACYLAIVAGLGVTLMLLAFYQKALPALPVSIMLGVLFYVLTRLLLEVFVLQFSLNLMMF
ncbi:presenilin-like protein At2g29900 isoform X2 [Pistacia vera]|uniref:presenilin-like protein At2g29900 isoform X2 n=1 Tax=Pistacia vera TaxID=55513 RepID=UPI001263E063|nr:presenilin-like protein At2g29900 isoform X2 [Pistacia vera]